MAELVTEGRLEATTDFSRVSECDFVAICVPTPLDIHQQPDTSYMENSAREIAPYLKKGVMVVLESTTYPGTTEDLIRPILEKGSASHLRNLSSTWAFRRARRSGQPDLQD